MIFLHQFKQIKRKFKLKIDKKDQIRMLTVLIMEIFSRLDKQPTLLDEIIEPFPILSLPVVKILRVLGVQGYRALVSVHNLLNVINEPK